MSNLKLPTMTFDALSKGMKIGETKKLAYATYAKYEENIIFIIHHTTTIAAITPDKVRINTGGWESMTTTNRLHKILTDNHTGYGAAIRQREAVLINMDDKRTVAKRLFGVIGVRIPE